MTEENTAPSASNAEAAPTAAPEVSSECDLTPLVQLDPSTTEAALQKPDGIFLLAKQNDGFQIPFFLTSEEEVSRIRPPAVVKTWEQRFAELNPKQQEAFHAFRKMVAEAPWYLPDRHDDWMCLRYLIARSFDLKKSLRMLENTAKWHKESGAAEWTVCEACQKDPNQHCGQFVGWDKEYRPVMFMSMRWGPERTNPLKHMICCFNHMIRMMPVGVEKWVCMSDFETYSHLHDSNPSMGIGVIRTIQDHFPERLGKMMCINPPTMFWVLYRLLKPVVDPVTLTKVEFVYTEDKPSVYDSFPKLFPKYLREFLYDSYHRSRRNLPAAPLVWYPNPTGYPTNYEERKEQLKAGKEKGKADKQETKKAEHEAKKAEHEAKKAAGKEKLSQSQKQGGESAGVRKENSISSPKQDGLSGSQRQTDNGAPQEKAGSSVKSPVPA